MSEQMRRVGQGESFEGDVRVTTLDPLTGKSTRVKVLKIETAFVLIEYLVLSQEMGKREEFISLPMGGCKREWMSHDRFTGSTRKVHPGIWP